MIKKSIFIVLAVFGLSSFAGMHEGMDHMSDMMNSSGEEAGFKGSVWLRYKAPLGEGVEGESSYRAHLGWAGDVNEMISWNVSLSSTLTDRTAGFTPFGKVGLVDVHLEQAYVSYMPMDGLSITAGKRGWSPNFHKVGLLYDEWLFFEGVSLKYKHAGEDMKFYAKVAAYELDEAHKGPFTAGTTLTGKVGGHFGVSEGMHLGVFASATHDGLFKDEGVEAKTLAKLGLNLRASQMPVPAGLFAVYVTNVEGLTDNHSYTGGVYVGTAGHVGGEANDFGLAVSYYDISEGDYNTALLHRDYLAGAGKGLAVRAQYNVAENTSAVAKLTHDLGEDVTNKNSLVGELVFQF